MKYILKMLMGWKITFKYEDIQVMKDYVLNNNTSKCLYLIYFQ